ncbi:MAG TPA: FAD-dependent oxidoreductase [Polyangiaceae bacterium]|jgi:ferredoxin-NADP reductase|nr:FAD-dependent oxidoreductase [Polyangiaceae bacterium]
MPLPPHFEARVASARVLTPAVRELTFERVDGRPMEFEPGQWVNVILPVAVGESSDIKRSYSIASPPDGTPRFSVAVTRVQGGPGSTWLHAVEPGTTLGFIGPQGFFTRPVTSGAPALMVATGTGVTPMRSMLLAAAAAGSRTPSWLLLGVRREEDLLYRDELQALADAHPFLRFDATLSQPGDGWMGRHGYVQTHVRAMWEELSKLGGATPPHAYVCGLERMVGSVRDLLRKEMGLPRQQVHSERYD